MRGERGWEGAWERGGGGWRIELGEGVGWLGWWRLKGLKWRMGVGWLGWRRLGRLKWMRGVG